MTDKWLTPAEPLCLNSTGELLAGICLEDQRIAKVWNVQNGKALAQFDGHTLPLAHVTISSNGKWLATVGRGQIDERLGSEIKVWDVSSGKLLFERNLPGIEVTRLAISPNVNQPILAIAYLIEKKVPNSEEAAIEASVQLIDITTKKEIKKFSAGSDHLAGLNFDGQGKRLAAVGALEGTVLVYDLMTGLETKSRNGPNLAMDVVFTPDGRRLVVAGRLMVKMLDASTCEETLILRGLKQAVYNTNGFNPRVRISPDGQKIVAICHDSEDSLSVWSIDSSGTNFRREEAEDSSQKLATSSNSNPDRQTAVDRRAISLRLNSCRQLDLPFDRLALEFQLSQLNAVEPSSVWEYIYRSSWNCAFGDLQSVERDWQKVLEIDPNNPYVWLERASVMLEHSRWPEAREAQRRALELQEIDDPALWRNFALLQLESGNKELWRTYCKKLVERYGKCTDQRLASIVLECCTAAADPGVDMEQLVPLLELIDDRSEAPDNQFLRAARNAVYYRIGNLEKSAEAIHANEKVDAGAACNVLNWLLMAMTQHRLGNSEEASRWLEKANARVHEIRDSYRPILSNSTLWTSSARLYLELLLRESNDVIGKNAKGE